MAELRPGPQDAVVPEVLAAVARAYPGLGQPGRIVRNAVSANSAGCLFETHAGRFFAKGVLPSVKALPWVAEEHRIIRHLVQAGFPTPRVLVNDRGSTVTPSGGRLWAVFAAAEGEDRYSDASVFDPFGSAQEAEAAGRALARLHLALADFPGPRRRPFVGPVAQCELAWSKDPRAALGRLVASQPGMWDFLCARPDFEAALEMFDALRGPLLALGASATEAGLPAGLIHGDWIKRNMFFSGDEVTAIVDFDLCNLAPLVFDLALAISAAAYPWPLLREGGETLQGGTPHSGQAASMQAGYSAVRPLSETEIAALVPLIAIGRFEYHVSLAGTALGKADPQQAEWFWNGQVTTLRWWYNRGSHA